MNPLSKEIKGKEATISGPSCEGNFIVLPKQPKLGAARIIGQPLEERHLLLEL